MKDCRNCAGNLTCDHHNYGYENCGNWQPVIVYCKDCRHWDEIKHGYGWCCATTPAHVWTNDDEYCNRGEREET